MQGIMDIGSVGIGGTILIGIIAGWIAEKVTGSNMGLIMNLIGYGLDVVLILIRRIFLWKTPPTKSSSLYRTAMLEPES